jgi:hypothetical protein
MLMSRIGKYVQSKDERKRYMIDYSDWLDTGEGISAVVFEVLPVTEPPLLISDQQINPTANTVQYYISGGLTGLTYEAVAMITTSMSQIKEDGIIVSIREP